MYSESQTLKARGDWKQGYNGQAMVDCESQIINAQTVKTDTNDTQQLVPMLAEFENANLEFQSNVLVDAGSWSNANAGIEYDQTELFIATTQDWKRRKESWEKGPPRGPVTKSFGSKELLERKLRTKRGRDIYCKRSESGEPVFGQHVNRYCDWFIFRREDGAAAEWLLVSTTQNLLKLWRMR